MRGTVKWFNKNLGYGFITNSDGKDVFVHYNGLNMEGFKAFVNTDELVHTARSSSACFPVFQCTLSAA